MLTLQRLLVMLVAALAGCQGIAAQPNSRTSSPESDLAAAKRTKTLPASERPKIVAVLSKIDLEYLPKFVLPPNLGLRGVVDGNGDRVGRPFQKYLNVAG